MAVNLDKFQDVFDNMTVNNNIMQQNFGKMTDQGTNIEKGNDLMQQLKNEVQMEMNKDNPELFTQQETQEEKAKEENKDEEAIDNYIKDLKSF